MTVSNVTVERMGKNRVKLTIEVPPETLEEALSASYKKNAYRFSFPGFRKGKAPRAVFERVHGPEPLYEYAIDAICPACYEQAIIEKGISPVGSPDLNIVAIRKGEPFVFTLEVDIKPDVTLGLYKGVRAPYKLEVITDDDIDEDIKRLAETRARLVPVEGRPAQLGDLVVVDYKGSIDGIPIEGGEGEGRAFELGSGKFFAGLEDQIVGRNPGEEFETVTQIPEDFGLKEANGKDATFLITLHSVKMKEVPEIDDDFASDYSEFDTLAEMREGVRKELAGKALAKADAQFEDAVIRAVADGAEVDVPESMVDRQMIREIDRLEARVFANGFPSLEDYIKSNGWSSMDFESLMRRSAERSLRSSLVLEAVAVAEGIDVADDEVEAELRDLAAFDNKNYEEYAKGAKDGEAHVKGAKDAKGAKGAKGEKDAGDDLPMRIKDSLRTSKCIGFLVSNAKKENVR